MNPRCGRRLRRGAPRRCGGRALAAPITRRAVRGWGSRPVEKDLWLLSQGGAPPALPAGRGRPAPPGTQLPATSGRMAGPRTMSGRRCRSVWGRPDAHDTRTVFSRAHSPGGAVLGCGCASYRRGLTCRRHAAQGARAGTGTAATGPESHRQEMSAILRSSLSRNLRASERTPRSRASAVPRRQALDPPGYASGPAGVFLPWVELWKTMGVSCAASTVLANPAKDA